ESEFTAAFRNWWTRQQGMSWSDEIARSFANHRVVPADNPAEDTPAQAARRAFLASDVGIRIDLFFGGGSFDFFQQARAGRLVDSGILVRHAEWFGPDGIPQSLGGEPYYDAEGLWIGTALSAFGICSNRDSLQRLGLAAPPSQWSDLGDPILMGQVAMADPTKSGSIAKAYEMLIQQQMLEAKREGLAEPEVAGWARGLQLLQRISGNARYFTDAASKIVLDVALGDAAAGMSIDFYGRQQMEAVADADGNSRVIYISPVGGTSVGVDPIGLLRGAPHREVAIAFIDFVLSPKGQRLWNQKPGTPGGPERFALRRLPVQPSLYDPAERHLRSDPDVFPYEDAKAFDYRSEWTGPLFSALRFVVRVMSLEAHDEMRTAWRALVEAGFPPEATRVFHDVEAVAYPVARDRIAKVLASDDKLAEVTLARELTSHFRKQYAKAAELARQGK
ncbi:MAG: extracellular solute-binding protein, partial [Verrucomicrobiia bacterium]